MPWQSNHSESGGGDGPWGSRSGSGGDGPWGSGSGGGGSGGGGPWGGGGSGSGGGGPWGGGSGGGPPPNFEEALRRGQDRIKRFFPQGRSGRGIALIVLVAVAGWLLTGFYRVDASQQGVVLIFGELWSQTGPGLHYNLPTPIGEVITPEVTRVNRIEIGFQNSRQGGLRNITAESLMLTGDENIIDIQFVMFWRIKNAADFLFKVRNPELTVKAAAEGAMREIIGQNDFEFARTSGRGNITNAAKLLTQEILDHYQSGITITQVEVQKVDPPEAVIDAFRDVQAARADKERAVNEATAYANEITQRAEGEAAQIIASAEAYKEEQIARASGETQRFLSVYKEYLDDKDVTRRRLYLETMEQVLEGMDKVLIEDEGGGNSVLPYLPLDSLRRDRSEDAEKRPGG